MKIEKRNSSFRARKMLNGKSYSFTFDHKPTKAEIETALIDAIEKEKVASGFNMTFREACERYSETKKNVLSASTYTDYKRMPNRFPEWFLSKKIDSLTQDDINRLINEFALTRSPKTCRNYHGYVSTVLGTYRPSFNLSTTLPAKKKKMPYIPTEEEVRAIVDYSIGTDYEIPIKLMCYGLRRSEVCAITAEDVEGEILHINKAKVRSYDEKWIVQERNKVAASTRDIFISKELADAILEKGYAFNRNPDNIYKFLASAQEKLGIPKFPPHNLRHYFASKLSELRVPDVDILEMGGWETEHVMKMIYRHSMIQDEKKRYFSEKLTQNLF